MTCIAWDGTTLAADKQSTCNDIISMVTKIWRSPDGLLMGGSGNCASCAGMRDWVIGGRKKGEMPKSQENKDDWSPFIVIELDGSVSVYEQYEAPTRIESRIYALGTGSKFAMAAMYLGKSAEEAVNVAIALCTTCGGSVDTLRLRPPDVAVRKLPSVQELARDMMKDIRGEPVRAVIPNRPWDLVYRGPGPNGV